MDKTAADLVLVVVSSIVVLMILFWRFGGLISGIAGLWRGGRSAMRRPTGPDEDQPEKNPQDIGLNDKDIL